ncbi:OmpA family protein [Herbiconiux sp. KACC 21604]|uniref:OmpA family protein n=1 Tax=unclassified Herbiconiux TaxID=2618217 RepID=UPI0014929313|nr:OmpA family protein [Herbiconiux sp. SALV-R1]QJU55255.1 OmpA family protein [Herbiconiux sp. SALV-R1]WPO86422.1 OmpA family protein [Herbiconiux sp. KACC 21604]
MHSPARLTAAASALTLALTLAACSAPSATDGSDGAGPRSTSTATPSAPAGPAGPARASVATVAGYDVGDFPPVPLFTLPDLALLDASASAFTIDVRSELVDVPGVEVAPAHCDASGAVVSGDGSAFLYGDESGSYTGPDGTTRNYGDGSGSTTINGVAIENYGDGSGAYSDGVTSIQNYGDGSGSYSDPTMSVEVYGDGSGTSSAGAVRIQNYGDGSGSFTDGTVEIENYGDGSGRYSDGRLSIENYGDGTARVDGEIVDAEPLATVPPLGVFPPLAALAPVESCGTTITVRDGVLFDFDRSEVRADAAAVLGRLADALQRAAIGSAVVSGHTDSIGTDDYNQTLSEARADSVVAALRSAGVTAELSAEGFGESRPVAANELDGADNPAGRQLNRRVEIFVPAR